MTAEGWASIGSTTISGIIGKERVMDIESIGKAILDWLNIYGPRIILIGIFMILMLIAAKMITNRLVSVYKQRYDDKEMQKRAETLGIMFGNVLRVGIFIVVVILLLDQFNVEIGALLAAAGVAGIAIGFGAQHLVQDVTNGFFIILDDEIRVGDVVDAGGKKGVVEQVGFRQTVLRDLEGYVHFIPNSKIDVVTNMTKIFAFCLLDIGVAYREDVDEVIEVIRGIDAGLREDEALGGMILEPIGILGLNEFSDSAVIIRARIKVKPGEQWKLKREFNRRIKKVFDARNIEIPFPHRTVYVGQDKSGGSPPLFLSRHEGPHDRSATE
jgi:small conductance mechanosensitive channel